MTKSFILRITTAIFVLSVIGSAAPVFSQQGGLGVFRTRTKVIVLKKFPAKPKDAPIEILGSKPDRKHEDVCIISAKGGQTIFNAKAAGDLIEKMKEDARKHGADAIIIQDVEDRTWKPTQGVGQAKSSVLAIRYVDEE
jgi:hypothetical protein